MTKKRTVCQLCEHHCKLRFRKGVHPWHFWKRRVYNRIRDGRRWRRYSAIEDLG